MSFEETLNTLRKQIKNKQNAQEMKQTIENFTRLPQAADVCARLLQAPAVQNSILTQAMSQLDSDVPLNHQTAIQILSELPMATLDTGKILSSYAGSLGPLCDFVQKLVQTELSEEQTTLILSALQSASKKPADISAKTSFESLLYVLTLPNPQLLQSLDLPAPVMRSVKMKLSKKANIVFENVVPDIEVQTSYFTFEKQLPEKSTSSAQEFSILYNFKNGFSILQTGQLLNCISDSSDKNLLLKKMMNEQNNSNLNLVLKILFREVNKLTQINAETVQNALKMIKEAVSHQKFDFQATLNCQLDEFNKLDTENALDVHKMLSIKDQDSLIKKQLLMLYQLFNSLLIQKQIQFTTENLQLLFEIHQQLIILSIETIKPACELAFSLEDEIECCGPVSQFTSWLFKYPFDLLQLTRDQFLQPFKMNKKSQIAFNYFESIVLETSKFKNIVNAQDILLCACAFAFNITASQTGTKFQQLTTEQVDQFLKAPNTEYQSTINAIRVFSTAPDVHNSNQTKFNSYLGFFKSILQLLDLKYMPYQQLLMGWFMDYSRTNTGPIQYALFQACAGQDFVNINNYILKGSKNQKQLVEIFGRLTEAQIVSQADQNADFQTLDSTVEQQVFFETLNLKKLPDFEKVDFYRRINIYSQLIDQEANFDLLVSQFVSHFKLVKQFNIKPELLQQYVQWITKFQGVNPLYVKIQYIELLEVLASDYFCKIFDYSSQFSIAQNASEIATNFYQGQINEEYLNKLDKILILTVFKDLMKNTQHIQLQKDILTQTSNVCMQMKNNQGILHIIVELLDALCSSNNFLLKKIQIKDVAEAISDFLELGPKYTQQYLDASEDNIRSQIAFNFKNYLAEVFRLTEFFRFVPEILVLIGMKQVVCLKSANDLQKTALGSVLEILLRSEVFQACFIKNEQQPILFETFAVLQGAVFQANTEKSLQLIQKLVQLNKSHQAVLDLTCQIVSGLNTAEPKQVQPYLSLLNELAPQVSDVIFHQKICDFLFKIELEHVESRVIKEQLLENIILLQDSVSQISNIKRMILQTFPMQLRVNQMRLLIITRLSFNFVEHLEKELFDLFQRLNGGTVFRIISSQFLFEHWKIESKKKLANANLQFHTYQLAEQAVFNDFGAEGQPELLFDFSGDYWCYKPDFTNYKCDMIGDEKMLKKRLYEIVLQKLKEINDIENDMFINTQYLKYLEMQPSEQRTIFTNFFYTYKTERKYLKKVFKITCEKLIREPERLTEYLNAIAEEFKFE
ncbi:Conserved_hypothetical protein [Hexamita inflata]|uniref:Uncharacterized protein n=1 Tax=Hexamita inflata TaxID=28002 RepID=A0AA86Q204_9EUKA|nr:Conserved hypothetical protein [Hexamita inflata]